MDSALTLTTTRANLPVARAFDAYLFLLAIFALGLTGPALAAADALRVRFSS